MKLRAAGDHADPVNLTATPVHLGLGGTAVPLDDFDCIPTPSPTMKPPPPTMEPTDAWS